MNPNKNCETTPYIINKPITYVEDESSNIDTLATKLFSMVICAPLQFVKPFVG
jgi:hypothetical protein